MWQHNLTAPERWQPIKNMKLHNYKTGKAIREATIEEAAASRASGSEGVIAVDGVSVYVDGCNTEPHITERVRADGCAVAIVNGGLDGPAWAIGTSVDEAWQLFRLIRDDMGISPEISESEFRAIRITPESALAVLAGNPDAWEASDA